MFQVWYWQHEADIGKNQAKAKQHREAKLLLFENHSPSSSKLPSKNNSRYSKKCTKNKYFCLWFKRDYMINDNENEAENEKTDHIDTT